MEANYIIEVASEFLLELCGHHVIFQLDLPRGSDLDAGLKTDVRV